MKLLHIEREKTIFAEWALCGRAATRSHLFLVICCLAGGAGSASAANAPADQARPANPEALARMAAQLFESTCATCHGLDGHGAERGPNIATRPVARRLSDEEILAILRNGRPKSGMPAFGALGTAKLESLLRPSARLQGLDRQRVATGNSRHGREMFVQKGGCVDCHAVNGAGGFLGPDLSIYGAVTPFVEMREQIAEHDRLPRAKMVTLATRDGQTLTGMIRNEDNFSLQLQTMDGKFHFLQESRVGQAGIQSRRRIRRQRPGTELKQRSGGSAGELSRGGSKKTDANGKLKRRPVHHEEED